MKQREIKKTITYRWWRESGDEIIQEHLEALQESAEEKILEMVRQGYSCGELKEFICINDDDRGCGVEYDGWFESTTEVGE